MDKKQLEHYFKGGYFMGTYNPKNTLDISDDSIERIGNRMLFHQNVNISPIESPEKWKGQFRFNSPDIDGWMPEEDIDDLNIISSYIEEPEQLPIYMYRMTFTEKEQLMRNFGNGYDEVDLPFIVTRVYPSELDDYVINNLSKPHASKVEKAIFNGSNYDNLVWEPIYENKNNK